LQFLAQDVLNRAVQREQATGGTILIMNPRNRRDPGGGELPDVRSEQPRAGKPGARTQPAVADMYEPGSSSK
jgi:cell division protein FtsI/penicillin-binding protein 2